MNSLTRVANTIHCKADAARYQLSRLITFDRRMSPCVSGESQTRGLSKTNGQEKGLLNDSRTVRDEGGSKANKEHGSRRKTSFSLAGLEEKRVAEASGLVSRSGAALSTAPAQSIRTQDREYSAQR